MIFDLKISVQLTLNYTFNIMQDKNTFNSYISLNS